MLELLLANQEKAKADQARMEAKRDANRKRDREDFKTVMAEMNARMGVNQAEMRSTVCTFRSELKETIQREMRAAIQSVWSELDETTTCNEATRV
jgi:sRNA-binding carbon storage regulator CsrA